MGNGRGFLCNVPQIIKINFIKTSYFGQLIHPQQNGTILYTSNNSTTKYSTLYYPLSIMLHTNEDGRAVQNGVMKLTLLNGKYFKISLKGSAL